MNFSIIIKIIKLVIGQQSVKQEEKTQPKNINNEAQSSQPEQSQAKTESKEAKDNTQQQQSTASAEKLSLTNTASSNLFSGKPLSGGSLFGPTASSNSSATPAFSFNFNSSYDGISWLDS